MAPCRCCLWALDRRCSRLFGSILGSAEHNRLLLPELVASLMSVQEHSVPADLALDLGRFYGTAAHDAGTAGSPAGARDTIDTGQAGL